MIEEFQPGWFKGSFLLLEDRGRVNTGSKTRVYRVTAGGSLLGTVQWCSKWRKYAFYTNNVILEETCLRDLADFCQSRTEEQRAGWKSKSIVDWELVKSWENEGGKDGEETV